MQRISNWGKVFFIVAFSLAACSSPNPEITSPFAEQSTTVLTETTVPPTISPTLTKTLVSIEELLASNADCEPPCWLGLIPGKSLWTEAQELFNKYNVAEINEWRGRFGVFYGTVIPVPKEIDSDEEYAVGLVVDNNGFITEIRTATSFLKEYSVDSLSEIFNKFGPPSEVWLRASPGIPLAQAFYKLVVFYPEMGIAIDFDENASFLFLEKIVICPNQNVEGKTYFKFWESGKEITFQQLYGIQEDNLPYYLIEDVTEYSLDEFYMLYLNSRDTDLCFETPASVDGWPP